MKLREKIVWACLILSLIISVCMIGRVTASPTKLNVDPPSIRDITMVPGTQFTVNITVDYVEDLWGWEFSLLYDPSVLEGIGFEMGAFLGSAGGIVSGPWPEPDPVFNNTKGELPLTAAFLMENEPDLCPDGGGVLASITFEVISLGGSNITLGSDTSLIDAAGDYVVGGLRWYEDEGVWKIVEPSNLYPTDPKFLGHGYFDNRPQVYVTPPKVLGVGVGENFTINVNVARIEDLYSWSFSMKWDASLLNVTDVAEGEFLKRQGRETDITWQGNNTAGQLNAYCTIVGEYDGVSGNGTLAAIGFIVKGEGITALSFYESSFLDSLGEEISVGTEIGKGQFDNVKFHNVAVIKATPYPTEVEEGSGDIISIDVVVANTGSFNETNLLVSTYYNEKMIEESKTIALLEAGANVTRSYSWDTTDIKMGFYTIKANVTSVEEEVDLEDNTFTYGKVAVSGHNIAIISATIPVTVVYKGTNLTITVVVRNKGTATETFDVTAYYDSSPIETKTVESLPGAVSETLEFIWDPAEVAEDTYTISVNASVVEGEKDPTDNAYTAGTIEVLEPEAPPFPMELLIVIIVIIVVVVIIVVAVVFLRRRKPVET